jgi:hypothetical protein
MAKGLNKHTPDSDELLKRLETKDSSGLDDFEKEALEGFDSLDNVELAKNLNASLNEKLDEKYFQKEGGNKKGWMYLSMAAGLVLVVGLSIFFMNIMGDKKEISMENAPSPEKIANEVAKPSDLNPAPAELEEAPKTEGKSSGAGGEVPVTTVDAIIKSEEKFVSTKDIASDTREQQPDKDDGLTSRMVLKEKKSENKESFKSSDAESGDDLKNFESDKSKGPPAANNAPTTPMVVLEDQKAKPVQTAPGTKSQEENEKVALSKTNSDNNNVARNDTKSGKAESKKSSAKERRKDQKAESLGNEDVVVTIDESTIQKQTSINQSVAAGGIATGTKRDESGNYHNAEFGYRAYNKPQDYIKVEIDKSEMLKTNVKAFKAELTIDEKGLVTAVKFLTTFDNCTGCKKELEKILLNMPGWKAATKGEKTVTETVSFIYP